MNRPNCFTVPATGESLELDIRGLQILNDPCLNKGTSFTLEERKVLAGVAPVLSREFSQFFFCFQQYVFWIGVIGIPAPLKYLRSPLAHLFLETVVIGGANHELDAQFRELLAVPLQHRLAVGSGSRRIVIQDQ